MATATDRDFLDMRVSDVRRRRPPRHDRGRRRPSDAQALAMVVGATTRAGQFLTYAPLQSWS
jgi:hypothetical protein